MASNAVSQVTDKSHVCQVCLEDFKQPKMLPCLHTFCQPCLEKLLATEPAGKLDCPTCRHDVPLPENGVDGLESNFIVGERGNILEQQPQQQLQGQNADAREDGVPCTVCGFGNLAQFYCTECTEYMCQTCNDVHCQFKATTAHKVVSIQDLQSRQVATDDGQVRTYLRSPQITQVRPEVLLGGASLIPVKAVGEGGDGDVYGTFNAPALLAVTAEGEIIVTDHDSNSLQFLDKDGSFKKKVDLGFRPWCVAALTNGEPLVTGDRHRIHVLDKQGRESRIIQFGDKGQGQQQLGPFLYVTVNSSKEIIVLDWGNHKIEIFDVIGRRLYTLGSHGSGPGQLHYPCSVITDSEDNIIVADSWNDRVSVFNKDGTFIGHALTREEHGLNRPQGLAMTHDGRLVRPNAVIGNGDGSFKLVKTVGKWGSGDGQFKVPTSLAVTAEGDIVVADRDVCNFWTKMGLSRGNSDQIIVSDFDNHNVKIFDMAGRHLFTCGSRGYGPGQLHYPCSVITDGEDNIIVADYWNDRVSVFSRDGMFIRHVLTHEDHGLFSPTGLALTLDEHLGKEQPTKDNETTTPAKVAAKFQDLDKKWAAGGNTDSVLVGYAQLLVEGIVKDNSMLETEAMKSLGDVYLKRGTETLDTRDLTRASALYNKALARCHNVQGTVVLVHRLLHTTKIRQDITIQNIKRSARTQRQHDVRGRKDHVFPSSATPSSDVIDDGTSRLHRRTTGQVSNATQGDGDRFEILH
ncbi:tripartite motif-containing protein 3-like [Branchiostoma floridae]|uniref:RING-type E3 ubiquitin transferase n=2 Tax=Branchiostoma floridae TaxID=7739 RepID=A0A9J7LEP1_BRAFL|nr:tripartite motif-containing protein 3-like [Branchiostoma floridae]